MTNIVKKHKYLIALTLFIITFFILELPQLNEVMLAEGDAYSRANMAKKIFNRGFLIDLKASVIWLPLHSTILSLPALFIQDIYYAQRLISLIISTLSISAVYFYTQAFTKNKLTSLFAALMYAFFPLRRYLSTQTLSEPVFVFFLILAMFFLIKEKRKNSDLVLSLLLLNIAHGIRYESWFLLPLLWIYILFQKIELSKKVSYILLSMFFPIYWMGNNFYLEKSMLAFFDQKLQFARHTGVPEFFNAKLTFLSWGEKLIQVFPISYLGIVLLDYKNLVKKISLQKIIIYFTPIYLYFLLLAQVFFGTMEWFPARYLLIPLTFAIPILANSITGIYKYSSEKISKSANNIYKLGWVMFLSIIYLTMVSQYSALDSFTKHEIRDSSLLNSESRELHNSKKYTDLLSLLQELKKDQYLNSRVNYYQNQDHPLWIGDAFLYFSQKDGVVSPKKQFSQTHQSRIFLVWEKQIINLEDNYWNNDFEIHYENSTFYIVSLPPMTSDSKDQ